MAKLSTWSDSRTAALYLGKCTPKHLNEELGVNLERRANTVHGTTARGGGWLYHRHDLERARAIMEALGCSASKAVWLLVGIRQLGKRELLPHLVATLEDAIKAEADEAVRGVLDNTRRLRNERR